MKKIREAIQRSAESASARGTAALRRSAYQSGWPGRSAASLQIKFSDNAWTVSGSSDAADLEYGNPDNAPNAAVRRFSNDDRALQRAFLSHLSQDLKGVL